jgi:CubicO group peptidase (beta-lactamase class C family)
MSPRCDRAAFTPIHDAMSRAVADRVFPGAVLLIDAGGEIVLHQAFGHAALVPAPEPMTADTVFDVASLTKPLVTATLTLTLVADGHLALDAPIGRYVPSWREGAKARATIRHLLTHTSGLPAWKPFYRRLEPAQIATPEGKRRVIDDVEREPLETEPGAASRYSDLGFILLGSLIEREAGRPLDRLAADRIFTPLGLPSMSYRPVGAPLARDRVARVASTEACPWRGRVLRGEVHDENAYAMGGVSGHAGLFADARDVHRLVRAWQDARTGRAAHWPAALVDEFLTRQGGLGDGGWALGWTVPTPPSTSGSRFSPRSFGHLGFTGTSVWVDPDRDLTVVLLTNRVHPDRTNEALAAFRPAIHDLIYETVVGGSVR